MSTLYESYTGGNMSNDFKAAKWYCQTFTPAVTHTIKSAQVQVYKVGNGGVNLQLAIRLVDGDGKPTGGDLVSGSLSCAGITADSPGEFYEVTFGAGVVLTAGVQYALIARTSGGDSSNFLQARFNMSGAYAGGAMIESADSGSTWSTPGNWDMNFKDYGDPLPAAGGGEGGQAAFLVASGEI